MINFGSGSNNSTHTYWHSRLLSPKGETAIRLSLQWTIVKLFGKFNRQKNPIFPDKKESLLNPLVLS